MDHKNIVLTKILIEVLPNTEKPRTEDKEYIFTDADGGKESQEKLAEIFSLLDLEHEVSYDWHRQSREGHHKVLLKKTHNLVPTD